MATIVLGICGSIAAYKAASVASQLVKLGHEVHCVCTPAALHFVTPLTLMTLSRNPVLGARRKQRYATHNANNRVKLHTDHLAKQ